MLRFELESATDKWGKGRKYAKNAVTMGVDLNMFSNIYSGGRLLCDVHRVIAIVLLTQLIGQASGPDCGTYDRFVDTQNESISARIISEGVGKVQIYIFYNKSKMNFYRTFVVTQE